MPRNPYISHGTTNEKRLQEELLVEALQFYGVDVYFIPRKIVTRNLILNEVFQSSFSDAFKVEMYFESVDGFEGDGTLLSKFGLEEVRNQAKLVVSRLRWQQLVGRFNVGHSVRPAEGDLIFIPMVNGLFEIKFVEGESPFYQLQNLPQYRLTVEQFDYNNQNLNTGVEVIDQIERDYASTRTLYIETSEPENLTFGIGDTVTQTLSGGTVVTGEVADITIPSAGDVQVDIVGTTTTGSSEWSETGVSNGRITNENDPVGYVVTSVENEIQSVTDHTEFAQNQYFESQANDIIDWSETNPFGEANWIE
jgi:hypothetical protein